MAKSAGSTPRVPALPVHRAAAIATATPPVSTTLLFPSASLQTNVAPRRCHTGSTAAMRLRCARRAVTGADLKAFCADRVLGTVPEEIQAAIVDELLSSSLINATSLLSCGEEAEQDAVGCVTDSGLGGANWQVRTNISCGGETVGLQVDVHVSRDKDRCQQLVARGEPLLTPLPARCAGSLGGGSWAARACCASAGGAPCGPPAAAQASELELLFVDNPALDATELGANATFQVFQARRLRQRRRQGDACCTPSSTDVPCPAPTVCFTRPCDPGQQLLWRGD